MQEQIKEFVWDILTCLFIWAWVNPVGREDMSRYTEIGRRLEAGETVIYVEHGNSMTSKLKNGVKVTVAPCKLEDLAIGDVALAKVKGAYYLHIVKAIGADGRILIGNAHGYANGWTRKVFGKLVAWENPT